MLEKSSWTLKSFCLYIIGIYFFKILLCLAKSEYREMHEYIKKVLNVCIYTTRKEVASARRCSFLYIELGCVCMVSSASDILVSCLTGYKTSNSNKSDTS